MIPKNETPHMDVEKVKLIIRNLELLIDSLKTEIYPDIKSYKFDDIEVDNEEYEIFEGFE